jgi:hypothetical protein
MNSESYGAHPASRISQPVSHIPHPASRRNRVHTCARLYQVSLASVAFQVSDLSSYTPKGCTFLATKNTIAAKDQGGAGKPGIGRKEAQELFSLCDSCAFLRLIGFFAGRRRAAVQDEAPFCPSSIRSCRSFSASRASGHGTVRPAPVRAAMTSISEFSTHTVSAA